MKKRPLKCKEVKEALLALGFKIKKTNHGSHEKYAHDHFNGRRRVVTVDCPKSPFTGDLVKYMAAQAGLKTKEFWEVCAGECCPVAMAQQYT